MNILWLIKYNSRVVMFKTVYFILNITTYHVARFKKCADIQIHVYIWTE